MKFNKKGQGALEYLLIIGGALVIAAVVVTVLSSGGSAGSSVAKINSQKGICATATTQTSCDSTAGGGGVVQGYGCDWTAGNSPACAPPTTCASIPTQAQCNYAPGCSWAAPNCTGTLG